MQVVSNTSPIVNLAAIGQLDLLRLLFGQIHIPEAVYHEIVVQGAGQPGAREVIESDWIVRQAVSERRLVTMFEREVDRGEAEALALATEVQADWVLLDERAARELAATIGLQYTGILGVLARAKAGGAISEVGPHLDALRSYGFWISGPLYRHILEYVGE